jgi:hypothetical protein
MRRHEFITLLGGAGSWSLTALARPERARGIGVLMPSATIAMPNKIRSGGLP